MRELWCLVLLLFVNLGLSLKENVCSNQNFGARVPTTTTTTVSTVRSTTPKEVIPEEVLENKHICDYCRETNYSSPYYDTDFTNNWPARVVKNISSLSQCQDKCTQASRKVKGNRKNCIAVAYKQDVNRCYLKFPRRKLIKIEKHGIVSSRRCGFGSFNMQNECSTRKMINMNCAVYSGTHEPEVFMKEIPCDQNRVTSTIPFPVSSMTTTYYSTTTQSSILALSTSTLLSTAVAITVTSTTRSTTTLALSCEQGVLRCARTCISKRYGFYKYCDHGRARRGRRSFCYGCSKWTDYQYLCSNRKFDLYDYKWYQYIYKRFSVPTEDCRRTNNYYSYFDFRNKY